MAVWNFNLIKILFISVPVYIFVFSSSLMLTTPQLYNRIKTVIKVLKVVLSSIKSCKSDKTPAVTLWF